MALGKRLGIAGIGQVRILGWCCSPAGKTWQLPTFSGGLVSPRWPWLNQMGFWRYGQASFSGAGCVVGKSAVNLQVSVPSVTPLQGRLGGTSRKEALLRLCGAVCITNSALWWFCSHSHH